MSKQKDSNMNTEDKKTQTSKVDPGCLCVLAAIAISAFVGMVADHANSGRGCCGKKQKQEQCLDSDTITKTQQLFWNQKIIRSK